MVDLDLSELWCVKRSLEAVVCLLPVAVDLVVSYVNSETEVMAYKWWWWSRIQDRRNLYWLRIDRCIGGASRADFLKVFYAEAHVSGPEDKSTMYTYRGVIDKLNRMSVHGRLNEARCVFLLRLKAWALCQFDRDCATCNRKMRRRPLKY
jgi:hypothetical protein